jgi:hypothetical protein
MTIINPTSISGINSITSGTQNSIAFYDVNGGSNLSFLVGSASSTGTASQPLQVTGGAYVSGSLGIGTTNPAVGQLQVSSGPVIIGTGTSTGTTSQRLQVTGDTYVSGNAGIGTTTPINKLDVIGNTYVSGSVGVGTTAPASTVRLDVVGGIKGTIVQRTSQVSTAGTSIDFTEIPSWVKRITVMFNGVSTNGTSAMLCQLGAGSITSTGYTAQVMTPQASAQSLGATSTSGFVFIGASAANVSYGHLTATLVSGNLWLATYQSVMTTALFGSWGSGAVTLSGTLDRVRITTANGTDTFDAGSINILYEG